MMITKITKVIKKYEIKAIGKTIGCSLLDVLNHRDKMKIKSGFLKKCFICDCNLDIEKEPALIFVEGLGNRFSCDECYKELININNHDDKRADFCDLDPHERALWCILEVIE